MSRTLAHIPVYPIRMWSFLNTIKSIDDKINNSLESYKT